MFFFIHVFSTLDWNQNDAVTLFLFLFSFLFPFSFFLFFFYYISLIVLCICCDLINKILPSFSSRTSKLPLYAYWGPVQLRPIVIYRLYSVFHILYLFSRLDNIIYSPLFFWTVSYMHFFYLYFSLLENRSRQFLLWWCRFNKLAHKFVYSWFREFFIVQYHHQ